MAACAPHAAAATATAEPFAAGSEQPSSSRAVRDIDSLLACFDTAWGLAPRTHKLASTLEPTAPSTSNAEPPASETLTVPATHHAAAAAITAVTTTKTVTHMPAGAAAAALNGGPPTTTTTTNVTAIPMSGTSQRHAAVRGILEPGEQRMTTQLPMTPPPPHGPMTAAKLIPQPSHLTPSFSHAKPVAAPKPAVATSKANGSGARASDFASVFFSPIPLSYLSIARSESHESILAQSVGSPTDVTLRGGRLSTAALNSDWAEEAEALSAASALAALQRSRSGEAGPADANYASLLQPSTSSELGRKAHLAAVGGRLSNGGVSSSNGPQAMRSIRSHVVGSHSSTSPDSVLSSEGQLPTGSTLAHSNPTSALHPLLSRGPAAAILSSSPAQPIPRPIGPSGASLIGLPDALLPALSQSDMRLGAGISIAAAAASKSPGAMLRLVAGTAMIPHIDKVDKGGEDACCVSQLGLGSIGVADGVSGWAEEGIDPAAYSRSLMNYTSEAFNASNSPQGADPREVIRYAHMATVMAGSSTICVAVMKPGGKLQVANLGDSGVRLIREGRVVFATTAQQHMFNMPFQLSHPSIIESPDDADSADVNTLEVRPGDIVVLATDGLYDNMFDEEIAQICTDTVSALALDPAEFSYSVTEAEMVAKAIARRAHAYAQNPHQRTPWSVAASETGLPWARLFAKGGGKMDDVTVVVGFVVPDQE